ncbi:MAG: hypothetical protein HY326_08105 [Chloroflexi bacterium]|nr:hypothetical protein [Chloroflexota bacterium]
MRAKELTAGTVAASMIALSGVCGLAVGAALVLPWPVNLAPGFVALPTGVLTLAAMGTLVKVITQVAPVEQPTPEQEPERPRWEVVEPANAFDVDLISQLRNESETLLIQAQPTLTAEDPLTREDLAWILWRCYRLGNPSRKHFVGELLPSARRLTRTRYDETIELLTAAGIITDRQKRFAGRWAPGLALSQALEAISIDPEGLPLDRWELGSAWLGLARLGTSGRFLPAKVITDERGA